MTRPAKPEFLDQTVYDNLSDCPVGNRHAYEVCYELSGCARERKIDPTDKSDSVEGKFDAYASDKQLLGEIVSMPDTEVLGRITNFDRFSKYLAGAIYSDRETVKKNLRRLAGRGPASMVAKSRSWFQDRVRDNPRGPFAISPPTCWLFRGEDEANAELMLHGPEAAQLPIRLGLPDFPEFEEVGEEDYIGFCILAGRIAGPRSPSIFDAGYLPAKTYWKPGGLTVPLSWGPEECIASGGIQEVVDKAPTYLDIEEGVAVLRSMAISSVS